MISDIDSYLMLCALFNRAGDYLNDPEPQYDDLMYTLHKQGLLNDFQDVLALCINTHRRVLEARVQESTDDVA